MLFVFGVNLRSGAIRRSRIFFFFNGKPLLSVRMDLQLTPGGSAAKNSPTSAGDEGSITGLGRCPGGGTGDPLQYSGLGNHMDRGAWGSCPQGRKRV